MTDGIRKPWLVNYLIHYAERNGGQLSSSQPKLGKVQIINFRTLPESPEEWVWADVSDKRHTVPVRFTMESVKAFNNDPRNTGRRLTSRRWGIASIRCIRPLWCKPPAENGKGLEERWTLALEVDRVEVAGSEGEAMFGEPRHVIQDEMVRRWTEGLSDSNGPGGNVLKSERLERERKAMEPSTSAKQDKNTTYPDRLDNVSKATSGNPDRLREPDVRQRYRGWRDSMKEKGLVWSFGVNKKIPDDQLQRCSEITVFGMDLSTNNVPPGTPQLGESGPHRNKFIGSPDICTREDTLFESTSRPLRSTPQKSVLEGPTTPSQWTASQRTQHDQDESDEDLEVGKNESSLPRQVDPQPKEEDLEYHLEELQVQESIHLQEPIEVTEEETVNVKAEATRRAGKDGIYESEAREDNQSAASTFCMPMAMRAMPLDLAPIPLLVQGRPIILAPDSDVSGSQSRTQSQSLTQASQSSHPSNSQRSLTKVYAHKAIAKLPQHDIVPDSSDPWDRQQSREPLAVDSIRYHDGQNGVENSELESDDEAARRILASGLPAGESLRDMPRSRLLDTASQERPSFERDVRDIFTVPTSYQVENSPSASPMTSQNPGVRGTKRHLDDVTTPGRLQNAREPVSKRYRGNAQEEIVVQHVDHDADAWRGPSFANLKGKNKKCSHESPREIRRHDLNKQTSMAKSPYDPNCVPHGFGLASGMSSTGKKVLKTPHVERDVVKSVRQQIHRTQTTEPDGAAASAVNARHAPGKSHIADTLLTSSSKTGDVLHGENGSPGGPEMSKLGGWRPRHQVTSGSQILSWEKFNSMLLKVGQVRESNARRK